MNKISVVIPTLGSNCLFDTIEQLNKGTLVPDEILVCIPNDRTLSFNNECFNNVTVIATPTYGQVNQRIYGFNKAKNEFILQLDDDIYMDINCLELLFNTLNDRGVNAAVSPVFYENNIHLSSALINNKFYQNLINPSTVIRKIKNFLLHGNFSFNSGEITLSGINIHFDPSSCNENSSLVNWLPGGCVLHRKANLILTNFFPFSGKAFCEDIIHSHYLNNNSVNLYISRYSSCILSLDDNDLDYDYYSKFKNLVSEFKARWYFVKISGRSYYRLVLLYFSLHMFTPFRFFFKLIKRSIYGK